MWDFLIYDGPAGAFEWICGAAHIGSNAPASPSWQCAAIGQSSAFSASMIFVQPCGASSVIENI
jgi:hypothetical protein